MKKLIFIILILISIWLLFQLYVAVASEKSIYQVIPYLNDVQSSPPERRLLLVGKND